LVYYADEFALGEGSIRDLPRERFVRVGLGGSRALGARPSIGRQRMHHDVLIALDEGLGLNNGQPSLWAFLFNKLGVAANERVLHLGSGTGYYTANAGYP
jgi:protein-L-isoaspartate(D-aspartate) O-methyltransferase